MLAEVDDILETHDLRHTGCREEVLSLFLKNEAALAHSDVEQATADQYDRVTLYRTLKTFLDKGILHKVLDDSGSMKYALCKDKCDTHEHHHQHVHFKCIKCGKTTCLDEIDVPAIKLPSGFVFTEANILVQGTCSHCNK